MNVSDTATASELPAHSHHTSKWAWLRGLQVHMTLSYIGVTVASVLILEIAVFIGIALLATTIIDTRVLIPMAKTVASQYAQQASSLSGGKALDPAIVFSENTPTFLTIPGNNANTFIKISASNDNSVPYVSGLYPGNQAVPFALLIAPDGRVLASTYPRRYPVGLSVKTLLPNQSSLIDRSLASPDSSEVINTAAGRVGCATQIILNQNHMPIGVVYVQIPESFRGGPDIWQAIRTLLQSGLIVLIASIPIGGLFGIVTTRGLVRRIRKLVTATADFAHGNYTQQVRVTRKDEIGQLEQQFNTMAEQLLKSIARQRALAEQNARLGERSRISRELHDAISQDLFSLSMLAGGLQSALPPDSPVQGQIATLEQTTNNMLREMRALLLELRPTQLEHLGLKETLEELATTYSTRLGISVTTYIDVPSLDAKAEHTLLRITQEALANAVRHSNANEIIIALLADAETIRLTISDNGKGFDIQEQSTRRGLGLRLMQERTQELHGTLELQSAPEAGTHIYVELPNLTEENEAK